MLEDRSPVDDETITHSARMTARCHIPGARWTETVCPLIGHFRYWADSCAGFMAALIEVAAPEKTAEGLHLRTDCAPRGAWLKFEGKVVAPQRLRGATTNCGRKQCVLLSLA